MVNPLVSIEIQGRTAELLFTPYLYVIARERGIEIIFNPDDDNVAQVRTFVKIIYAAHLNAVELRRMEGSQPEEFGLMDIEMLSVQEPKRFIDIVNIAVRAMTGKAEAKEVKKKK